MHSRTGLLPPALDNWGTRPVESPHGSVPPTARWGNAGAGRDPSELAQALDIPQLGHQVVQGELMLRSIDEEASELELEGIET